MSYQLDQKPRLRGWGYYLIISFKHSAHPKSTLYLSKNKELIHIYNIYLHIIQNKIYKANLHDHYIQMNYIHIRRVTRRASEWKTPLEEDYMDMEADAYIQKSRIYMTRDMDMDTDADVQSKSRIDDARLAAIYSYGRESS